MNKYGLIIDSSSNISQKKASKLGIELIPLTINIDGKAYKSGIDIDVENIYKKINKKVDMSTSLPLGEDIRKSFDDSLKKNEKAIFIGLSHKLSGTVNAARVIAEEDKYKGKIFVYTSQYVAPWTNSYIKDLYELVTSYKEDDIQNLYKKLDLMNEYMIGFLSPGDIYYFYKGGRITKTQYIAANILKLKPILIIEDGMINQDTVIKIRTLDKALNKIVSLIKEEVETKIKKNNLEKYEVIVLESNDIELTERTLKIAKENFKDAKISKQQLSAEQIVHMGPGSFGMALGINYKELLKK